MEYYEIDELLEKRYSKIYFASFYKYLEGKPTEMLFYEADKGDAVTKTTLLYDSLQRLSIYNDGKHTRVFYEYESRETHLNKRKVINYSDWIKMQNPTSLYEESYFYNERGLIQRIELRSYVYVNGTLKRAYEDKDSGLIFQYK